MARGYDVGVKVFVDGELQAHLAGVRSAEFDPGLEEDIDEFLGDSVHTVEGTNGPCRMSLTNVLRSADYGRLCNMQRKKNKGDEAYRTMRIMVSMAVDFGYGDRMRIKMGPCTLVGGGVSSSSRSEKVTAAPALVAPDWKRIS